MKEFINKKNILIVGTVICLLLIGTSIYLKSKEPTVSIPATTPSPTSNTTVIDSNPAENTPEWNASFNKTLSDYEKTRNASVDKALSEIRLSSPVSVSENIIEYDYKTATYNITLVSPYVDNQNKVLSWFGKQGIDQNVLKTLRLNWIQK